MSLSLFNEETVDVLRTNATVANVRERISRSAVFSEFTEATSPSQALMA